MNTRVADVCLKVVGFVDAYGELHIACIEDDGDEIFLVGNDIDDEPICFESEAYHLPQWCTDNEFDYYEGELETDVVVEKK